MTMGIGNILIIGVHAWVAWILIEIFVNLAYPLSRVTFILLHYLVVVLAFSGIFWVYYHTFWVGLSPFEVTAYAMGFALLLELVVFRFLYSGERWFLNFVDWILPVMLATTTIYATGLVLGG